jgi:hypothetical protein
LRFLNIFNFYIENEASGINIEDSIVLMDDGNKDSKSRPKLTIETKAPTTGNKGLDLEKEWRQKSAKCEHPEWDKYYKVSDGSPKLDCDAAGDATEEKGLSNFDKETNPIKHPAVNKEGDWAWICKTCNFIKCRDCTAEYSDQSSGTPTPSQVEFPNQIPQKSESDTLSKPDASTSESSASQTDVDTPQSKDNLSLLEVFKDINFEDLW